MATFIPTGALAAMSAAGGSAAPDLAQDFTLAQLDIIAAASGGAMHAVSNGAVDPFVFRFSIFVADVGDERDLVRDRGRRAARRRGCARG